MNLGFFELLLILFIILLIYGSKKLPELGKALGDTSRQLKDFREKQEKEVKEKKELKQEKEVKDEDNVEG